MNVNLPVPTDGLQHYMAQVNRFKLLSRDEERALAERYAATGNKEAAQELVVANLRFVIKIAYEYQGYGFRMADLIQEGNVGLLTAVKKFDPKRGFKLISYAVWWIRAMIQNFILRSWSLVKLGTTQAQRKLFYKLRESKRRLLGSVEKDFDQTLGSDEAHILAEDMALKQEEVLEMDARLMTKDLYLNAPVGEEGTTTHQDLLCEPVSQEEIVCEKQEADQRGEQVGRALDTLNPRERYIIQNRLMADDPMTLQDLGNHFAISRERARQLETRAKTKLKLALEPQLSA